VIAVDVDAADRGGVGPAAVAGEAQDRAAGVVIEDGRRGGQEGGAGGLPGGEQRPLELELEDRGRRGGRHELALETGR
jgi:hypothetical protein